MNRKLFSRCQVPLATGCLSTPNHNVETVINTLPGCSNHLKKTNARVYKKKLVLLLPAHNEEIIIQATIMSAVAAGQPIKDILVVDDCSGDQTRKKAVALLGHRQVLTVERSGKANAVYKAIKYFNIEERYRWLHIADSDSVFGKDYFKIYRKSLIGKKYVIAIGFVQSLRGNWLSNYRAFIYTYNQQILRRAQSLLGMITVLPGPVTCFRTDIIKDIDFTIDSLTEDFDITLQVHRKRLGRILFIPEAVNYTQDPQSLRDYCKQTARWQRGFFQGITKYHVGTKAQPIDLSICMQILQIVIYIIQFCVLLPYILISTGHWIVLPIVIISDFFIVALLALFSGIMARRLTVFAALPYFYLIRWVELFIFIKAFGEVIIFRKFRANAIGWDTEGRRYALNELALKDTAQ